MEEPKKKHWNWTLILCVVLLAANLWQLRQISDLRGELGNTGSALRMEMGQLNERILAVHRLVKDANTLVQDWEVVSVGLDGESRCLRMEMSLRLKEWREDTQVHLAALQGPDTRDIAMSGGGGQYSGTLELPVNSREIRLFARISAEGFQKEEELSGWESASMLLPIQCFAWGFGEPDYARNADKTGTLTVTGCEVNLSGFEGRAALPQLSGQVFRLRRNGEIAAEKTAMYGDTIDRYTCGGLSADARIGDEFILTFFCRDESGLGYEFFLQGWTIDEGGLGGEIAPEADWPKLTWD